jgi:hypothetical protein
MRPVDPRWLLYMIWATTQHYADFAHQIETLNGRPLSDAQWQRGDRDRLRHHPARHRAGPAGEESGHDPPAHPEAQSPRILDAALEVFSAQGFRGATLDQIAGRGGAVEAQPALLFRQQGGDPPRCLSDLLDTWLDPLGHRPAGDRGRDPRLHAPQASDGREFPRESRCSPTKSCKARRGCRASSRPS